MRLGGDGDALEKVERGGECVVGGGGEGGELGRGGAQEAVCRDVGLLSFKYRGKKRGKKKKRVMKKYFLLIYSIYVCRHIYHIYIYIYYIFNIYIYI